MWRIATLALLATAAAQIPSLGWCPDYQPMANFNMNRFLGSWHEAERYFTVTEVGSRCVTTTYEKKPDGRVWVSNEIRSAFTGMKRVMDGTLQLTGREGEGKVMVKYTSLPLPYDAEYYILDTDYDNYAVVWSCSGIGPVHTQSAWLLTRERLANSAIMQAAYGVLDKFKISRAFFIKTNQEDCSVLPPPVETAQVKESVKNVPKEVPGQGKSVPKDVPGQGKNVPAEVAVPEVQKVPEPVVVEQREPVDAKAVGKSNVPVERVAAPEIKEEEPTKAPVPIPEFIMKESEKEKPIEAPPKEEIKPEIKESNELKEEKKE